MKILDFGLAKLTEGGVRLAHRRLSTTAAGLVLGTVGYMSPEQARGEPSDHRADIFSFGAVLYEMLSGQRAFQGNSPVETLSAILKEQPPDLTLVVPGLSPGLARIVDRCLEKNRDDRFQSAADLRFALEAISGVSTPAVGCRAAPARAVEGASRRPPPWRWPWAPATRSACASPSRRSRASSSSRSVAARCRARGSPPTARRSSTARPGKADRPNCSRRGPTHPRPGRCRWPAPASSRCPHATRWRSCSGPRGSAVSSARWPGRALAGGVPRQLAQGVLAADWRPDGSELAIVRTSSGREVLEYPIGRTLYDPQPGPHHPHPHRAGRRRGGRPLASGVGRHGRGHRAGGHGRPCHHALVGVEQRARPGLGAGRPGGLVHRHAHRCGAGDSRRQPQRPGAADPVGAGDADAPRHRARWPRPGHARRVGRRRDGAGPGQRAASATCRGSTARRPGTSRPTAPPPCSRNRGRAAAPPDRSTCARPTARRRCGSATACRSRSRPTSSGCCRRRSPPIAWCCCPPGWARRGRCPPGRSRSYFPAARFLPDGQRFLVSAAAKDRPTPHLPAVDRRRRSAAGERRRRVRPHRRLPGRRPVRDPRPPAPARGVRCWRRRAAAAGRGRAARPPDRRQRGRRVAVRAGRGPPAGPGGAHPPAERTPRAGARAAAARPGRDDGHPPHPHDPRRRGPTPTRSCARCQRCTWSTACNEGPFWRCHPVTNRVRTPVL